MLERALLFDEQTSHKSIGQFMKFGPGFFCGDRMGLTEWLNYTPSKFAYSFTKNIGLK